MCTPDYHNLQSTHPPVEQPKFKKQQYKREDYDKSHCHPVAFRVAVVSDESRFPVFAIADSGKNEREQDKQSIISDNCIISQAAHFICKYKCRNSHNQIPIFTQNKVTGTRSFLVPLFTLEIQRQQMEQDYPVLGNIYFPDMGGLGRG